MKGCSKIRDGRSIWMQELRTDEILMKKKTQYKCDSNSSKWKLQHKKNRPKDQKFMQFAFLLS